MDSVICARDGEGAVGHYERADPVVGSGQFRRAIVQTEPDSMREQQVGEVICEGVWDLGQYDLEGRWARRGGKETGLNG